MKSNNTDKGTGVPSAAMIQFNQLQPEIISLLTHAPKYGKASLEIHFMDGDIMRVIRRREESQLFSSEGENR